MLVATESAVGAGSEDLVLRLLLQLVVILLTTHVVVRVVRRLGQTQVSGEILAGLLLGPSVFGAIAPGLSSDLFHHSTTSMFTGLAQLGLILLMFQIGMEFDFSRLARTNRSHVFILSLGGVIAPFALGYLTAPFFYDRLPEAGLPDEFGFRVFFALAMSITAIPILGRIFLELGLSNTRVAALTIGAASIDDVLGWLLLGSISLVVSSQLTAGWVMWHVVAVAIYLAVVFAVVRPTLRWLGTRRLKRAGALDDGSLRLVLIALFASAAVTSQLDVFAVIGGFVLGVTLHDHHGFVQQWRDRVAPLARVLLLPLFFTYTGLRTEIGSLGDANELVLCLLVVAVAFAGKLGGALVAARVIGEPWREAGTIAVCMNTRALMELVALNVGLDIGVLTPSMYTKLVVMAIVSTFVATPLIRHLMRHHISTSATTSADLGAAPVPMTPALAPVGGD